jgi:hypothetical protein
MAGEKIFREWIDKLDELAGQANENLRIMFEHANKAADPERVIADALVSIASQMAYGNAVAAATFYMQNRMVIVPRETS